MTDKNGEEIPAKVEILDDNRISITADTNYTGLQVVIEGQVEKATPLLFLGENSIRFLTGLKNVSFTYSLNRRNQSGWFYGRPQILSDSIQEINTTVPRVFPSCWAFRILILTGMPPTRAGSPQTRHSMIRIPCQKPKTSM